MANIIELTLKVKIDWDSISTKYNIIAIDSNGEMFAYAVEPVADDNEKVFKDKRGLHYSYYDDVHYQIENWKETLLKRPKVS